MGRGVPVSPAFMPWPSAPVSGWGTVELPATTDTAPMTFMHEGRQYIVMAVSGPNLPGSLVALRLPT